MSVDEWEVRSHFCVLRCLSNCSKRVEISVFFEALAKRPQELMVSFRDLLGDSTENKHQQLKERLPKKRYMHIHLTIKVDHLKLHYDIF